jgi:hydroxymethylglutaryl-CoA synthase
LRPLGSGSATLEFLDRWRLPGERASHVWEERFGKHVYVPLVQQAFADALKAADVGPDALDHVVVTGVHSRAVRVAARAIGVAPEVIVDDLASSVGNTGTAHAGLLLAGVLDRAESGQRIATVSVADGCDVVVGEANERLGTVRPRRTLAEQLERTRALSYETFLTWRGFLDREPPRRPDPKSPAAPPSLRSEDWKFGFTGSQCEVCGERHLPPARVCANCRSIDQMAPVRMADVPATVTTFTVDRLTFSPSPPLVAAVLDFDGGGRFRCELTDVDADRVAIGDRVEMTFRRVATAQGVHNYFWKARPRAE